MTRGVSIPARLTAGIVLLLFLLLHTFGFKLDSDDCTTFCGNIHNISYPFRLTHQPPNCGHRQSTLSCEDNQTVLYLFAGKYYVQEINYDENTIRVVDSGIQKDNYSSIPRYFLNDDSQFENTTYDLDLVQNNSAVAFLMCEKAMNPPGLYLNKSSCFESGVYSSNSALTQSKLQGFAYVISGWTKASDVDASCRVEHFFGHRSKAAFYQMMIKDQTFPVQTSTTNWPMVFSFNGFIRTVEIGAANWFIASGMTKVSCLQGRSLILATDHVVKESLEWYHYLGSTKDCVAFFVTYLTLFGTSTLPVHQRQASDVKLVGRSSFIYINVTKNFPSNC